MEQVDSKIVDLANRLRVKLDIAEADLTEERARLEWLIDEAYIPGRAPDVGIYLVIQQSLAGDIYHDWETDEVREAIRKKIDKARKGGAR